MSDQKEYKIKTIQDIINCTNNNNLDNFIEDLKSFLKCSHSLQQLAYSIADSKNIPRKKAKMKNKGFIWIDDNKHEIKISVSSKKTNEK